MSDLPQTLGKYTITRELGRGGFATVYLAHDTVLRRDVALKILHPALLNDPAFVTHFENEARAIAQFDHPHIATIYDFGQHQGRVYIAVRFISGGSLADHIKRNGPLTFADAVRVIEHVADALDHAHAAGFIHRDVKPSNILLNGRGAAVLTDFGLVKAAESSVVSRSTMGGIVGTPPYMAPEVWEDKPDSPQTDIYALGCVLFEALVGEPLFQGNTSPAIMRAHFEPHRYPEHWPDGTPKQVEEALEQALNRDPTARYASAGALATDLRQLATKAADPLAEPYQKLQSAIEIEVWEVAADLAQQISTHDPSYRDVRALGQRAAEALAQIEATWQAGLRAQEAARWRAEAEQALAAKDVAAARRAIESWRAVASDDAAIWQMQILQKRLLALDFSLRSTAAASSTRPATAKRAATQFTDRPKSETSKKQLQATTNETVIPEQHLNVSTPRPQTSSPLQKHNRTSWSVTASSNRAKLFWTLQNVIMLTGIILVVILIGSWLNARMRIGNIGGTGTTATSAPTQLPILLNVSTTGEALQYAPVALNVATGHLVSVNFKNASVAQKHNWVLVDGGDDVALKIDEDGATAGNLAGYIPSDPNIIANVKLLNGNTTDTISFAAPPAGTYTFLCTFPGHYVAGMKGILTVK